MIQRRQIKVILDVVMTIALLFLMAIQVAGDKYHEWLGAGMLLLFVIHNVLNWKWYRTLFKGKYSAQRVVRAIVNLAVLVAIVLTGYSGIVLSRHVFAFLPIDGGMATARKSHLAGSYWAFVLMSIHLGMHWSMMTGKVKAQNSVIWVLKIVGMAIAFYGAVLFGRAEIFHNMFLQNAFAILDYETPGVLIILQNLAMMSMWIFAGHYLTRAILKFSGPERQDDTKKHHKTFQAFVSIVAAVAVVACAILSTPKMQSTGSWQKTSDTDANKEDKLSREDTAQKSQNANQTGEESIAVPEEFILIKGGTFQMGSPDSEDWRSPDETLHGVTVSDFYMSAYELTQEEYETMMGKNPGSFAGENLPVENISWMDAIAYCNARSEQEGLTPVYLIEGGNVSWNRGADGYRLPTEAEWEYACRAGTTTPFNTETSISAEESNYYGHYPYEIEGNYFDQDNLTT